MKRTINLLVSMSVIAISVILCAGNPANAQDDEFATFTFPSDVSFAYPSERWELTKGSENDLFVMLQSNEVLAAFIQVYDLNMLLGEPNIGLDFMLQTFGNSSAQTWGFDFEVDDFEVTEIAGRELHVLAFEGTQNDSPVTGYLVIVPYSDDSGYGQITAYAVGDAPPQYAEDVLLIAGTLDSRVTPIADLADALSTLGNSGNDENADPVDVSGVALPNTFEFPKHIFAYPESWTIPEGTASEFFVMLQSDEVLAAFIQVNELNALYGGTNMGFEFLLQTYGDSAAQTWGFDFEVDNFEIVEIGGRDLHVLAFEGEQNDKPVTGYVVIVPYSNEGGYGQITAYAVSDAPAAFEDEVLAIAASFDIKDG